MLRTILTFAILATSFAYITKVPDFWYLETFNYKHYDVVGSEVSKHRDVFEQKGPVWVVDISQGNVWWPLRMKIASDDERNDFHGAVGPVIQFYETRRKPQLNKNIQNASKINTNEMKSQTTQTVVADILKLANKFVLSALDVDPTAHLPDTGDQYTTPSVAIFFKQLYSALFIKYGRNEWHFFIRPPSPFPKWFFEDHEHCSAIIDGGVDVPKEIANEFYQQLLRLMRKYFSRADL